MGKYMRKCRGAAGAESAAVEVTQVVGVRTRSRAAAGASSGGGVAKVVPKRRKQVLISPATEPAAVAVVGAGGGGDDGSCCYLQLRSRMLFKAPSASSPLKPPAVATAADAAGEGAPLLSRCSSTASSVDASAHQDRTAACRSSDAAAEAGGDHVPEGSASNSGCGRDRDRRETTPSSQARGELSDLESDLAGHKSLPAAPSPPQPVRPPAAEIEEFFAAAEAAEAQRFTSKYNFDVVRGVPLNAGRFEWTPVVSI